MLVSYSTKEEPTKPGAWYIRTQQQSEYIAPDNEWLIQMTVLQFGAVCALKANIFVQHFLPQIQILHFAVGQLTVWFDNMKFYLLLWNKYGIWLSYSEVFLSSCFAPQNLMLTLQTCDVYVILSKTVMFMSRWSYQMMMCFTRFFSGSPYYFTEWDCLCHLKNGLLMERSTWFGGYLSNMSHLDVTKVSF
jgi:hypothetical protein